MYCPTCGTADQQPESYCRSCGDFLTDYSSSSYLLNKVLGGSAPSTQVTVNLVINFLTICTCFLLLGFLNGHYDALENRTGERPPSVIYLVYAFLVAISAYQILSLIVGARLRSKLVRKEVAVTTRPENPPNAFADNQTQEFLPPADLRQTTHLSVTEDSTKILHTAKLRKDESHD
jgi:hypothetical protein